MVDSTDIFVSYKREDRQRVMSIVESLRSLDLGVWFDAALEAGETFDEEISRQLAAARAHLVCWTPASIGSRWVRSEAHIGAGRNLLVPVFLEPCVPPPPFNLDHTVDLTNWNGEADHGAWQSVLSRIGSLMGRGAAIQQWAKVREQNDVDQIRTFIRLFSNDPLTGAARQKAFDLGIQQARNRLREEFGIEERTDAAGNVDELRRQLEGAQREQARLKIVHAQEIAHREAISANALSQVDELTRARDEAGRKLAASLQEASAKEGELANLRDSRQLLGVQLQDAQRMVGALEQQAAELRAGQEKAVAESLAKSRSAEARPVDGAVTTPSPTPERQLATGTGETPAAGAMQALAQTADAAAADTGFSTAPLAAEPASTQASQGRVPFSFDAYRRVAEREPHPTELQGVRRFVMFAAVVILVTVGLTVVAWFQGARGY